MRVNCPGCGATMSLDALLGTEGARDAVLTALAIPAPIGKLLVQYVGLFRPAQRQLSLDRVNNLLAELLPMIEAARIERNGRSYVAPLDYWRGALETMLAGRDKLTLPLKSHGYLLEIIAGYADKAEAKHEARIEEERRHPAARIPDGASKVVRKQQQGMPAHISESLGQFRNKQKGENDGDQE